ncbi:MAG: hypothetical protein ACOYLB_08160 [Phototrophicaceae bacterium]
MLNRSLMLFVVTFSICGMTARGQAIAQSNPPCPSAPLRNGEAVTSPDGRYQVYFECWAADQTQYDVYATDLQTQETILLGETATDLSTESIYVYDWISPTMVSFRAETGGGTYNWRSFYVAEVDQTDSLTELARDYVSRPRYETSPERIEWAVEDGIQQTLTVYQYSFEREDLQVLYNGTCDLRDDLGLETSCHMVTPNSNTTWVQPHDPTHLILNRGDSIHPTKQIEVRALPEGEVIYQVETLGGGHAEWVATDTIAVYEIAFDFKARGYAGLFIRFENDTITQQEPFVLPIGESINALPSWLR